MQDDNRVMLPAEFVATVPAALCYALDNSDIPVSVRLNPFKPIVAPTSDCVAWCHHAGYYLDERPIFTADPLFHGGAYYVQEASSMFVGWLLRRIIDRGYPTGRVLDLCAAPGGKSTHLASVVGAHGVVVANEVIRPRAAILSQNIQKWGSGNVVVTNNDPADFGRLPGMFDVVVIDAPCSGEGMFRKDRDARAQWSVEAVELCAARGRRIASDVWAALRPGGVLIYSTCTFNSVENDNNVEWIARELGGECITDWAAHDRASALAGISDGSDGFGGSESSGRSDSSARDTLPDGIVRTATGYQFYPHLIRGEGFFAAVIRKDDAATGNVRSKSRPVKGRHATGGLTPVPRVESDRLSCWVADQDATTVDPGVAATSSDTAVGTATTTAVNTVGPAACPIIERFFTNSNGQVYGFADPLARLVPSLLDNLRLLYSGVMMGELIHGSLKPSHAMALYAGINTATVATAHLDRADAMEYLRKGQALSVDNFADGLNLVVCGGIPIGWAKRVGTRYNNLYPQNWRVLHY